MMEAREAASSSRGSRSEPLVSVEAVLLPSSPLSCRWCFAFMYAGSSRHHRLLAESRICAGGPSAAGTYRRVRNKLRAGTDKRICAHAPRAKAHRPAPPKGDTQEAASGPRSSMGCALQRGYEFRSFALSESHLGCRRRCDRGPDHADGPGCHHTVSMTPRAVSRGCGTQRRPPAGGLFALPTRRPPVVMCLGLARDLSRAGPKTSSLGTTTRDLGKFKSALGDPLLRRATGVLTAPRPSSPVRKYKKVEISPPSAAFR